MNIDKNREFKEKIIDNDFNLEFQFTEIVKYISNLEQENTQLKMQIDELNEYKLFRETFIKRFEREKRCLKDFETGTVGMFKISGKMVAHQKSLVNILQTVEDLFLERLSKLKEVKK